MHKNIISISQLCRENNVYVEFLPTSFSVKDQVTNSTLLTGPARDGVYHWPVCPVAPLALATTNNHVDWHHRLGHPSLSILNKLMSSLNLSSCSFSNCNSCSINKSHKLPFGASSLTTIFALEVIFSDVWSSPVYSINSYKYYVVFIDHYTHYIWLCPLKKKSDTAAVFLTFKSLVEKQFSRPILTLYSDNGGEFQKLDPFLATHGISHFTSPPHTPEHNGFAERRHRHIAETGLALLTHTSMPLIYWPYAFHTATYLINRLPTPTLSNNSPFSSLFGKQPNYTSLHNFGCLYYPLVAPLHPPQTRSTIRSLRICWLLSHSACLSLP